MLTIVSTASLECPLGRLKITATDRGIDSITFAEGAQDVSHATTMLQRAMQELEGYFLGSLKHFSVPLVMRGTEFQQRVWDALLTIPFGQTVTYGEIAKEIGHPLAVRAVGTAVGENPLAIIVPFHRVLPASGGVGNYASGSDKKAWLLRHEGVTIGK
jgi:methylated-DNA-[protein]-cysteine S-methyltransferase